MLESLRSPEYRVYRDAALGILERRSGRDAVTAFELDEIFEDGSIADLSPAYAFLEAQGYRGATTSVLSRVGLAGTTVGTSAVPSLLLGFPLGSAGAVVVPGWDHYARVAVDQVGLGLVLLDSTCATERPEGTDRADDYLTTFDVDYAAATVLVAEDEISELRPQILARTQLAAAAELLGLTDRLLDDAIDYSKSRQQFGQPIAAFQAMQHGLAWAATDRHQLASLFDVTVSNAVDGVIDPALCRAVKAMAGKAAHSIVQTSTQVSGAISFTWEYSLNRLHRRVLALDQIAGSSADLIAAMGREVRLAGTTPELLELCDVAD